MVDLYRFIGSSIRNGYWGEIDCYKNFIYLPFVSRKNKPNKIQKRFHLVNSETFLSLENEGYIRDVKKTTILIEDG